MISMAQVEEKQSLITLVQSQAKQISELSSQIDEMKREQKRFSKHFYVLERQVLSNADLKDDVEVLKRNDSTNRYDLRLLKASVGELISADKSYSLELEQSVASAKQMLRSAFGEQKRSLTHEIGETVKLEVLNLVDKRLASHLENTSIAAARAADNNIEREREDLSYYIRKKHSDNQNSQHSNSQQGNQSQQYEQHDITSDILQNNSYTSSISKKSMIDDKTKENQMTNDPFLTH
jgi:hypothetical protein